MPTYTATPSSSYSWTSTAPAGTTIVYPGQAPAGAGAQPSAAAQRIEKAAKLFDNGANIFVQAIKTLNIIEYARELELVAARVDLLMADIQALSQKSLLAANLSAKSYTSAVTSSISSIFDGVNEGAYAAANNAIELGAQHKLLGLERERIELENKNTKNLREVSKAAVLSNLRAEKNEALATAGAESARLVGHATNGVEIAGFSTGNSIGAAADATANLIEANAASTTAMIEKENELIVQAAENEKKVTEAQLKAVQDVEKEFINAAVQVEKAWLQLTQKVEGGLLKTETTSNNLGINLGLSGRELDRFKHSLLDSQLVIAKWGKSLSDVAAMQEDYTLTTGRNIQFSNNDWDTSLALDKLLGKDGASSQMAANMEIFNYSVADSNELVFEMYKNVSKIGLNARKYMTELLKNLKLAEKYHFKDGVKGLMEMSKWAQNTRFNMDSLSSMIDDIHNGGLEGLITKAAQMQVLGGSFAMGADPLSMGWESYMNPQALAERQNRQMSGVGFFNSKTGEVEFGIADQMLIEAFAKASGQSKEDLMNQRRQSIKGDRVLKNLSQTTNWSEDDKALITNKAHLVNGEWMVTMDDGTEKSVSSVTSEDLNHLKPSNNEEKLVNYVYDIRDMVTRLAEVKETSRSRLERDTFNIWYEEELKRIVTVTDEFNTNYAKYLAETTEKMRFITQSQSTMLDLMSAGNESIDQAAADIRKEGANIASALSDVNKMLRDALAEIEERKDEYKPQPGEIAYEHKMPEERDNPYGHQPVKAESVVPQSPPETASKKEKLEHAAKTGDVPTAFENSHFGRGSIMDGIATGNNSSMLVAASKVTPIHDGGVEMAQSDPMDHAIFAKVGGPFDKLFNGILKRINYIYDVLLNSGISTPKASVTKLNNAVNGYQPAIGQIEKEFGLSDVMMMREFSKATGVPMETVRSLYNPSSNINPIDELWGKIRPESNVIPKPQQLSTEVLTPQTYIPSQWESGVVSQNGQVSFGQPLKIELGGKIELGLNGQSMDVTKEITNNPIFIRQLTHLISEAISRNMNGGRTDNNGGQLVGGIGFSGT